MRKKLLVLLGLLAIFEIAAQWAALTGLVTAFIVSVLFYRMPLGDTIAAVGFGAAYGLLPIGWISWLPSFCITLP